MSEVWLYQFIIRWAVYEKSCWSLLWNCLSSLFILIKWNQIISGVVLISFFKVLMWLSTLISHICFLSCMWLFLIFPPFFSVGMFTFSYWIVWALSLSLYYILLWQMHFVAIYSKYVLLVYCLFFNFSFSYLLTSLKLRHRIDLAICDLYCFIWTMEWFVLFM